MRILTMLALLPFLFTAACQDDSEAGPESGTTYHRDVAPMLAQACTVCHAPGASAPFALDNVEDARTWAAASVTAISSGRMPPWLPDASCREFANQRSAPVEAVATLEAWIAQGMPEGTDEDGPVEGSVSEPDFVFVPSHVGVMAEPYLPDVALPDDYRCFVLDTEISEDSFLLSSRAVPEQTALVHHVLVYAIGGAALEEVLEADAAEGTGYQCFGAPFPSDDSGPDLSDAGNLPLLVGTWVPGTQPPTPTPGVSTLIPAGSRIVMQIHYNTLAGDVVADDTRFEMMISSVPTPLLSASRPVLLPGLFAAANDPTAINKHLFKNYTDEAITIVRLGPHMHLLGSRYKAEVVRESGESECAIVIPDWDFNWQEGYFLAEDAPIVLAPGDGITLECEYDNTLANQPSINGVIEDPADIYWGEGTRDEMCMNYLTMIEPYSADEGQVAECSRAGGCLANCADGQSDMECLLDCQDETVSCLACGLTQTAFCASSCVSQLLALRDHPNFGNCFVNRMALGSSFHRCLEAEASEAYSAYTECTAPLLEAGSCDEAWTGCGMDLTGTADR